jgi:hypothetical protein
VSDERGPELARFQASPQDQRTLALVRGGAGALALLGSLALLFARVPIPVFLIALLGIVMALAWLRQARKLWRRAGTAKPPTLVVHRAGIVHDDTFLPFEHVTAFEVDEERVDVKVCLAGGDTLRIEPQYQGVDIYTLVRTLQDALANARRTQ